MLNIDVAITYGWNRVGYNILRSLSKKGLKVGVGDVSKQAMAKKSKYCQYAFSYPSFYKDPKKFIKALKSEFSISKPKVYFPTHEEIFIVSKYIAEFDDLGVTIPISHFEMLRTVHKNDLFNKLVNELGLPSPMTFKPTALTELKMIWNELGSNGVAVVKLANSNSSKGVFYVRSYNELYQTYEKIIEKENLSIDEYPIIQEYVDGEGYGVSMLLNNGAVRAKFTHKRLREKIATGGTSTRRISVKNPMLEEYAEHLLTSINWHGVAMVEFKYNEKKNKGWLIEVNPRFWGSLALPIMAGVDFPYLLYKMAIDGDVEPVLDYKEGIVARWILGDILATLSHIKADKSVKPIIEFFRSKHDVQDDFYWDDMKPFYSQCSYYLSKFIRTASFNPVQDAIVKIDEI